MKVSYRDYKNIYSSYNTKKDSYNSQDKSIVIYIPKDLSAFNSFLGKTFGDKFGDVNSNRGVTLRGDDKDEYISAVTEWINYWRKGLDMTNATPEEINDVVNSLMTKSMEIWERNH